MRVLILGGTTEASLLAQRLAGRADIAATFSYAGRTQTPAPQPIPTRIGGFGGIDGLATYLIAEGIDVLVDATHPFAAQISQNAAAACARTRTPLIAYSRAPWVRRADDQWIEVADNHAAALALGPAPRRVLLTIGRLGLHDFCVAPQHHYLIRTIDQPPIHQLPPDHQLILARGPFGLEDEISLIREEAIDIIVTKNSGGKAMVSKIDAARRLGLPVVMVEPPARPRIPIVHEIEACLAAIEAHRPAP